MKYALDTKVAVKPAIKVIHPSEDEAGKEVKKTLFFSTAEVDAVCDNGNGVHDHRLRMHFYDPKTDRKHEYFRWVSSTRLVGLQ